MRTQAEEPETGGDSYVLRHRNPLVREYVIVSRIVLVSYPELSDGAKLTYLVIYSHDWYEPARGGRKGYVYPTVGRLARLRHTTPRTIQRHLAELVQARLLARVFRVGKPSILYIEEPGQSDPSGCRTDKPDGSDGDVTGGTTKMSPHKQEQKEKQTKPINGMEKTQMEETGENRGTWKPIKALLGRPRPQGHSTTRVQWLAEQVAAATGDAESLGCYLAIAQRCPEGLVFESLSLLKEARREDAIRRSRGALFVGIVRRLCRERGLADPLGKKGAPSP